MVKGADVGDITKEDVDKLRSVHNVRMVDSCDYANDINYYIEEGKDYEYLYGTTTSKSKKDFRLVSLLNEDYFMLSTDCISEKDIAKGRLPESRNEIVLYSKDEDVLDSEVMCYFSAKNIWGTTSGSLLLQASLFSL